MFLKLFLEIRVQNKHKFNKYLTQSKTLKINLAEYLNFQSS